MNRTKNVLTTGEVAHICNVAPRTVSKWFDSGQLRGYRIPGSKDRRIPLQQLIRFMKAHGMPLDRLETGGYRLLIVEQNPDLAAPLQKALADEAGYEVRIAVSAFEAGVAAESLRPHALLMDVSVGMAVARDVARYVRTNPDLQGTRLIAIHEGLTDQQIHALMLEGFDGHVAKPFQAATLIQAIEDALAIAY